VLDFSRTVHEDLANYDSCGAWAVLLDEFVDELRAAAKARSGRRPSASALPSPSLSLSLSQLPLQVLAMSGSGEHGLPCGPSSEAGDAGGEVRVALLRQSSGGPLLGWAPLLERISPRCGSKRREPEPCSLDDDGEEAGEEREGGDVGAVAAQLSSIPLSDGAASPVARRGGHGGGVGAALPRCGGGGASVASKRLCAGSGGADPLGPWAGMGWGDGGGWAGGGGAQPAGSGAAASSAGAMSCSSGMSCCSDASAGRPVGAAAAAAACPCMDEVAAPHAPLGGQAHAPLELPQDLGAFVLGDAGLPPLPPGVGRRALKARRAPHLGDWARPVAPSLPGEFMAGMR
jgi:hypothetical protein